MYLRLDETGETSPSIRFIATATSVFLIQIISSLTFIRATEKIFKSISFKLYFTFTSIKMSVKSLSSASKGAISKSQSNPSLTSASTAKPKTPTSGLSVFKNMSISSSPSTTAATSGAVNKTTKKDDVKTVKEDPAILSGVQEIIAMDGCSRSIQIEQYLIVIQDASTSVAQRLIKAEILSKVTATLGVSSTEGDLVIQSISFSSFEHPQQSIREGAVVLAKSLLKLLGRM